MLNLDHLVISCTDLDSGAAALEAALGLPLEGGGLHPDMGTHNRLLSLGPDAYLELIAINPEAAPIGRPRWFNLDNFDGAPRLTNWVCNASDLEGALAAAPEGLGVPTPLTRGDLRWTFAIPANGRLPFDECFPALISWTGAAHPTQRLADKGVRLQRLTLSHPDAAGLQAALTRLIADPRLEIRTGAPKLECLLSTPKGDVTL